MLGKLQQNIFFILILSLISALCAAQDDTAPLDTIFTDVMLDNGNVVAVDSFGNDWYYDFKADQFVFGVQPNTNDPNTVVETDLINLPIEERCINELQIKKFSKAATVEVDEYVEGDILVMERVTIRGWVKGDVTSFKNRVLIASSGRVDGDVYASNIIIRDGGILNGKQHEAPLNIPDIPTEISEVGVAVIIIIMVMLFICIFLIVALMPKKLKTFAECYNQYTVRTALLGFLIFLLLSPFMALLAITIVGVFLIPLVPLLYAVAMMMGIAVFSNNLGRKFTKKIIKTERSIYFQTFVGFSLFAILWMFAISLMTATENSAEKGFGIFFLVISILISIVPVFSGLGTALLTRFGFRPYQSWKDRQGGKSASPAPAPPPIPNIPHIRPPSAHPRSPFDTDK